MRYGSLNNSTVRKLQKTWRKSIEIGSLFSIHARTSFLSLYSFILHLVGRPFRPFLLAPSTAPPKKKKNIRPKETKSKSSRCRERTEKRRIKWPTYFIQKRHMYQNRFQRQKIPGRKR
ncbi:hypothetical protein CDAR_502051 [Caerostris darwini]|uniref:Uncharacterized protein n=1 Tax=Caerostris darwini TaxID=1538125 RepID=A0AAV4VWT9_9ARAC|nr:hypothetical protein CDAR_502051 [Caerostris darwini]